MSEKVSKFAEHRNQTWKKTFSTKNGGWLPHNNWTMNHHIRDDDLLTMSLLDKDMDGNDLKISPVTSGYRCMDHLFQNIFDHITKLLKSSDLFNVDFIDQYFEVCVILQEGKTLFRLHQRHVMESAGHPSKESFFSGNLKELHKIWNDTGAQRLISIIHLLFAKLSRRLA